MSLTIQQNWKNKYIRKRCLFYFFQKEVLFKKGQKQCFDNWAVKFMSDLRKKKETTKIIVKVSIILTSEFPYPEHDLKILKSKNKMFIVLIKYIYMRIINYFVCYCLYNSKSIVITQWVRTSGTGLINYRGLLWKTFFFSPDKSLR